MVKTKTLKTVDYMVIDEQRMLITRNIYFDWKKLDTELRTLSTRGCNFPGELSENFVCYCFGFLLNKKKHGDCFDKNNNKIIEVKCGSSDTSDDLSSFSPKEEFDNLIFCKVDKNNDCIYMYDTGVSSNDLKKIQITKTQTVEDQQKQKRRPRFSVYKQIIQKKGLKPSIVFNIRDKVIENFDN